LQGAGREAFDARADELRSAGVPAELAARVAGMPSQLSVFDVVEVEAATQRELGLVMSTYFSLGSRLELNWLRERILELPRTNRWQALARAALRDDLYSLHRALTQEVLETAERRADADEAIEAWSHRNGAGLERCLSMLADIKGSRTYDTTTLPVALREVRNLIRGSGLVGGTPGAEPSTMAG
jgi:glutamate dehydrogenase